MKIGILTQPLKTNYGGLLQAYALQKTLKNLGHTGWIIDRDYSNIGFKKKLFNAIKRRIPKGDFYIQPSKAEYEIIDKHTSYFKKKYIRPMTEKITTASKMEQLNLLGFDAYIVGSDQVWRPKYSPSITNFFLDFTKNVQKIKKISYAASFGVDHWEFNEEQSRECANLAQEFDAISVRENSGLNLVKDFLKKDAVHVLDPTMLLDIQDYNELMDLEGEIPCEGNLMTYVLDITDEKRIFIGKVADDLKLTPFTVMQEEKFSSKKLIHNSVFPPVTKWLRGFKDAEFVITDSFHGCALAILFNKPFLALGNKKRGVARFTSLLKMFQLEERLILDDFTFKKPLVENRIDWDKVNAILKQEQKKAFNFLKFYLD